MDRTCAQYEQRARKAEEDNKRQRGRPRLSKNDSMKRDLVRAGVNSQKLKLIDDDGERWRELTIKAEFVIYWKPLETQP